VLPISQAVELSSVADLFDFPGYFVTPNGDLYSVRGCGEKPRLSIAQIHQIKQYTQDRLQPRAIAKLLRISIKAVTQAQRWLPWKQMNPAKNRTTGYLQISLSGSMGCRIYTHVHTLVALVFIGPRPKDHIVHHRDGNKHNNAASNLEYILLKENSAQYLFHRSTGAAGWLKTQARRLTKIEHLTYQRKVVADFIASGANSIPGFPGYFLRLEQGQPQVYSTRKGVPRRLSPTHHVTSGHLRFSLYHDNKKKETYGLHQLVAWTFIGKPPSKSAFVLHGDGNPQNNHPSNLRYGTRLENIKDAIKHSNNEPDSHFKLQDREVLEVFRLAATGNYSLKDLASKYNCHYSNIRLILAREARADIVVNARVAEAAQRILHKTPKRSPAGLADAVRTSFVAGNISAKDLAKQYGILHQTVCRMLDGGKRKDVILTRHLQHAIDEKLGLNIAKHHRALDRKQYREVWRLREQGWTQQEFGDKFGLHRVGIKNILHGKTYKLWYEEFGFGDG